MHLTEKVAYIKGLMEGMKLDSDKEEVKVLKAMADLLEDVTHTVSVLEEACDENAELIDVLDEDLGSVEEILFGDDDFEGCSCYDDDEIYEVTCPRCGETICLDGEMLDTGNILCPNCGEKLEFDFDLPDEEEDLEKK